MSLIYVTGNSGAGKSVVAHELQRRGYEAHEVDRDGNAVWAGTPSGRTATAASARSSSTRLDRSAMSSTMSSVLQGHR
jgi:dephospho-CoA kinase